MTDTLLSRFAQRAKKTTSSAKFWRPNFDHKKYRKAPVLSWCLVLASKLMQQSQNEDWEPKVEAKSCRAMAQICEWKAQSADPEPKARWLDLARRWRGLAAQIDAGDW